MHRSAWRRAHPGRGGFVLASTALAASLVGWLAWSAVERGDHHRLYRAIFYPTVAHRVTEGAETPDQAVERLAEFVYLSIGTPNGAPVLDDTAADTLVRGFGYCDQVVMSFVRLVEETGTRARVTFLRDADGSSPHTVAEVLLDDQWRVFDVFYGFVPRRADGTPATIADLLAQPTLLEGSRAELEWYRNAEVFAEPESLANGPAAARLLHVLVAALPDAWIDRLQDLYLWLPPPDYQTIVFPDGSDARGASLEPFADFHTPDARLFFRARNYHLFQRSEAAMAAYRELVQAFPAGPFADDALFQEGLLDLAQREDPGGALRAFQTLRHRYPDTPWMDEVPHLAGRALEDLGACRQAARVYEAVAAGLGNGQEDARLRLAELPCA